MLLKRHGAAQAAICPSLKIIGPRGQEIASLNQRKEGILSARIDLGLTDEKRSKYYTFFKDRRPDAYGDLVKPY
ncbi:MAG: hypothetical protein SOR93_17510 [Clostridiales Family XIII bacterium]|nr:hypothetical protein [Clostridia bacterium]MDE8732638.1 hypothetical protein [Eubacteriales bacterium DFI.9.88]MDE8735209.1 hypothetical protein [Eubacteriales bacterium DFI.9.88]MDY3013037.1 hypothetical protein [Clostridiales Family XIII bacterium]